MSKASDFTSYNNISNFNIEDDISVNSCKSFLRIIHSFAKDNSKLVVHRNCVVGPKNYFLTIDSLESFYKQHFILSVDKIEPFRFSITSSGKLLLDGKRLTLWASRRSIVLDNYIKLAYVLYYSLLKNINIDVKKILNLAFNKIFLNDFFIFLKKKSRI